MRYAAFFAMVVGLAVIAPASWPTRMMKDEFVGYWKIKVTPNGDDANQPGVKEFDETLKFTPDKLATIKTLAKHGFEPALYDEDVTAFGPAKFKCTQKSDKEGQIDWEGVVTDTTIQGTMIWTHTDKSLTHYDYQGDKADKP
jgi:hypothetical protein